MNTTTATSPGFVHDGRTTYCWRIPAAYTIKQPKWTDDVLSGEGKGCPISMELNLAATEVPARSFVAVNWTVRLEKSRFLNSSNALRQGAIVRVVDESTGFLTDVVHSNVHSCEFGSNCDPFRQGSKFVDNTPNKVGNFSDDGVIVFTSQQELLYLSAGIYSVLAHIIVPGANISSDRFDYAVFQRLTVKEATTAAPGAAAIATTTPPSVRSADAGANSSDRNTNSSGTTVSGGTISVIVVGAVIALALVLVIVIVVLRSRRTKHGAVSECSPQVPRSLHAPFEKAPRHDGYSELSSIPPLGHSRLGAVPPLRSAPMNSNYLSSADPVPVHRAGEMDIRDFDNTFEQVTSYQFEPDGAAAAAAEGNARRPQQIVDSTFSVDFVYPDSTTSTELLIAQRRMRQYSDELQPANGYLHDGDALDTNDSYGPFAVDNLSTMSSRVFSSASERSESVDGERFSDATDSQDVEL